MGASLETRRITHQLAAELRKRQVSCPAGAKAGQGRPVCAKSCRVPRRKAQFFGAAIRMPGEPAAASSGRAGRSGAGGLTRQVRKRGSGAGGTRPEKGRRGVRAAWPAETPVRAGRSCLPPQRDAFSGWSACRALRPRVPLAVCAPCAGFWVTGAAGRARVRRVRARALLAADCCEPGLKTKAPRGRA